MPLEIGTATTSPKHRKRAARDLKVESNLFQSGCTDGLVRDQETIVPWGLPDKRVVLVLWRDLHLSIPPHSIHV